MYISLSIYTYVYICISQVLCPTYHSIFPPLTGGAYQPGVYNSHVCIYTVYVHTRVCLELHTSLSYSSCLTSEIYAYLYIYIYTYSQEVRITPVCITHLPLIRFLSDIRHIYTCTFFPFFPFFFLRKHVPARCISIMCHSWSLEACIDRRHRNERCDFCFYQDTPGK